MSERKINLEELFNNNFDCYTGVQKHRDKGFEYVAALSKDKFKKLALEISKQLLELAAKNAEDYYSVSDEKLDESLKQSILNTIKQVE